VDGPVRTRPARSSAVEALWQLDQTGPRRYEGWCRDGAPGRVYGGQVVAQALAAAFADAFGGPDPDLTPDPDWWPESLHAYFVREGRSTGPIEYDIEGDDFEGLRFRRVSASQGYQPVLILETAFTSPDGPSLPAAPDALDGGDDLAGWTPGTPDEHTWYDERTRRMRLEMRFVDEPNIITARKGGVSSEQRFWFRTSQFLPDRVRDHACALAYASDMFLVSTALARHGIGHRDGVQAASIDHAVWFHRPIRADTWVRYDQFSPTAAGGRGLSGGRLVDPAGDLVATIRQEVLLRVDDA
jgi:acyl-CoA thioesterase-2